MSEPQTPPPAPPAQKKGLSPVAWILIGCLGLMLLAALGVGACSMFVAKKVGDVAGDFAENPGRAMAEMVVKMNPELELVSTDDESETITIVNKESGEEITVDWSDIENGNFSFSNDEGSFAIDASGGEGGAVVTMSDEDGTTTQTFGAGSTHEIPDWAPVAPGASEPEGNYSTSDGKTSSGAFSYTVSSSVTEVLSFYESTLTGQGYEVNKSTHSVGGKDSGLVAGKNEGAERTVAANVIEGDDGTQVTVSYSSGG